MTDDDLIDARGSKDIVIGLPIDRSRPREDPSKRGSSYRSHFRSHGIPSRLKEAAGYGAIQYDGDSHLLTVAPTGAGKGVSVIIPNLLNYTGPVVVFDPKGENYAVTSRRRRELGQKVIKLDPFGITNEPSDGFNPFDVFHLADSRLESDSQMLGELLSKTHKGQKEPFWDISATGLCSGLIAHCASTEEIRSQGLGFVWDKLAADDVSYALAVILDTLGSKMNKMAYQEISMFLQLPDRETRPSVLGTAQTYMRMFQAPEIRKMMEKSSFSMQEIVDGDPVTIYMIVPPDKLESHASLLKLWVGVLFRAITSRRQIPAARTLFMLDECAQLGYFPYLQSVVTLCRGYGLQVWTFWQDLSQLKHNYKGSWATMLNNCDVLQIFGARNYMVAKEFAEITGSTADEIRDVALDEQVIVVRGGDPVRARKLNYLDDQPLKRLADSNPLYRRVNGG